MEDKTGGPAFPVPFSLDHENGGPVFAELYGNGGMTLRDYLAAKVMAARIAAAWTSPSVSKSAYDDWKNNLPPDCGRDDFFAYISHVSYGQADAMLEACHG